MGREHPTDGEHVRRPATGRPQQAGTRDGDAAVIVVTRLNGGRFGVNPDLVQRVDSAPDTILTLVDGTKLIVRESIDDVIDLIHEQRAELLARAREIERRAPVRLVDELDEGPAGDPPPPVPLRPRSV